jgi:HlyD family secretion protein
MNRPFKNMTAGRVIQGIIYLIISALIVVGVYWVGFAPITVFGIQAVRGDIAREVMGVGTLEARIKTIVSTKISGRISKLHVDQGDLVEEGQVLLRLDDTELRQQAEIARSGLEAARATVERAEADYNRARAVLNQAELELNRNAKLFANKSISASDLDKLRTSVKVAEADLSSAMAKVVEAQKNLMLAQNNLDYHLARLEDTIIRASFGGMIIRRDRDPGDIVVPGTSIYLLISPEQLWVRAWVDETEMAALAVGQPARVVFRSEPDVSYDGDVTRLGKETDRETRQFIVDVTVDRLPENWSLGQRADVFIVSDRKSGVLVLPSNVLVRRETEGLGVWTAHEGRVAWRGVTIGIHGRENVEITSGLSAGDVVIMPQSSKRMTEGRRIEVAGP